MFLAEFILANIESIITIIVGIVGISITALCENKSLRKTHKEIRKDILDTHNLLLLLLSEINTEKYNNNLLDDDLMKFYFIADCLYTKNIDIKEGIIIRYRFFDGIAKEDRYNYIDFEQIKRLILVNYRLRKYFYYNINGKCYGLSIDGCYWYEIMHNIVNHKYNRIMYNHCELINCWVKNENEKIEIIYNKDNLDITHEDDLKKYCTLKGMTTLRGDLCMIRSFQSLSYGDMDIDEILQSEEISNW